MIIPPADAHTAVAAAGESAGYSTVFNSARYRLQRHVRDYLQDLTKLVRMKSLEKKEICIIRVNLFRTLSRDGNLYGYSSQCMEYKTVDFNVALQTASDAL